VQPLLARRTASLANLLFDAGRLAEAIHEYREAIGMDQGLLEARRNLAYALFDSGKPEAALQVLSEALLLVPGDPALRAAVRSMVRGMNRHP